MTRRSRIIPRAEYEMASATPPALQTERGARGIDLAPAVRKTLALLAMTALTAISAKVALPLPGTPVPFTFQPLAVLLAGGLLGVRLGAGSQLLYLVIGAVGLPVFAAGGGLAYLFGPTGGYLLAYPAAAALAGALAVRGVWSALLGLLAGLGAIYAGGLAWLGILGGFDLAVAGGLAPFLLADLVKVGLALAVVTRLRPALRRSLRS